MNLSSLLSNKTIKAKEKSVRLASAILNDHVSQDELITLAGNSKDSVKAICMEALEIVTRQQPDSCSEKVFDFALTCLDNKGNRVKWEAAKIISRLVVYYPHKNAAAVKKLLANSNDESTVVRWSVAKALSAILQLKTALNKSLKPRIEKLMVKETKRSIVKIYLEGLRHLV